MSPTRLPQHSARRPPQAPLLRSEALVPSEPPQPKVGEQFDKYQLLARLATGGMAELFVARLIGAAGFQKNVVIKRILPHVAHDENFTRMFLDEAITCAQISHPNVCQVFELCQSDSSHFLVLEHLEGATVGDLIRRCLAANQQVHMNLTAGIIVQACDGLHAAHEQVDADDNNVGLVHRDVSPGNIFVTVDGIVKLLDFGIAKAAWMSRKTRTGTLLGKCEYMSPEQARGAAPVDRRSDVFSLGIIAWEMLCGRRLFRRESEYETLRAVLRAPIERPRNLRPSIPLAFDNAIMRALERDPDDRFKNAYEFRKAVSEALRNSGGPTPMCDIAPIIRRSFADQLRMQRALIKEATRQFQEQQVPGMRKVPRGTLPGTLRAGHQGNAPKPHTAPKETLPSLSPSSIEDTASMELTFRVIPQTPPRGSRLVPVSGKLPVRSEANTEARIREGEVSSPGLSASRGAQPRIQVPQRRPAPRPDQRLEALPDNIIVDDVQLVPRGAAEANARLATSRVSDSGRASGMGAQLVLLLIVGLLGAGLAATLATIYYGKASAAPAEVAPTHDAPAAVQPAATPNPESAHTASTEAVPDLAANHASARDNEKLQEAVLTANTQGRNAIVTSLKPRTSTGRISIRSSQPATIYLYPSKRIIGTTPLIDFELPVGTHKLKAQIGEGRGRRKYFQLKVEANHDVSRSFQHW